MALAALLVAAGAEGVLRLLPPRRAAPLRPGRRAVVLCAGDSFTAGTPGRGYPETLERLLQARGLEGARVMNVGVGGENTAELCARLPGYLRAYRPDLLLLMIGVNDIWNHAGPPCSERRRRGRGLRSLALYRAARRAFFAWHRSRLEALPTPRRIRFERLLSVVDFTGTVDSIRHEPGPDLAEAEFWRRVREGAAVLLAAAAAEGVPAVVLTYPVWRDGPLFPRVDPGELRAKRALFRSHFLTANSALREAAAAAAVPVIEGQGAERFAEGSPAQWWNWVTLHPERPLQEAMAANVAAGLERLGLLVGRQGPRVPAAALGAPGAGEGRRR